jgi:myosin heavy subunit
MGLLPLLDEESKFPQASDLSLAGNSIIVKLIIVTFSINAAKLHEHFRLTPHYKMPKDRGPTFSIVHYAGLVR